MALRRGFKKDANAIALEIRQELGLRPIDPLKPLLLADHLAIQVIPLSSFAPEAPGMVRHFSRIDPSAFSALTVFEGTKRIIVHNDRHSAGRQTSNLAHELSHGLLLHRPRPALDGRGCRDWDHVEELEADCLAGTLLVPEQAAILIARQGLSTSEAAELYRVSEKMMMFRLNITAARLRVARAGARRLGNRRGDFATGRQR